MSNSTKRLIFFCWGLIMLILVVSFVPAAITGDWATFAIMAACVPLAGLFVLAILGIMKLGEKLWP